MADPAAIKRALLINPYNAGRVRWARTMPIRVGYAAGVLREAFPALEVSLFDMKLHTLAELRERLRVQRPDLVMIRVGLNIIHLSDSALPFSLQVLQSAREVLPDARLVLAGFYPTMFGEAVVQQPLIDRLADYILTGEEEFGLRDLVGAINAGRSPESVLGLRFKREGKWIATEPRPLTQDLDAIPSPAYDLMEIPRYRQFSILTSRGCPHHCVFCATPSVEGGRHRRRSPEKVVDEIQCLAERYGTEKEFAFVDDDFFHSRSHVERICALLLERNLWIRWIVLVGGRLDEVDESLLRLMQRAGCRRVDFGVESGSPAILKAMKKGLTVEEVREKSALLKAVGLPHCFYFSIGHAGETVETAEETIRFIRELRSPAVLLNMVTPSPGTELYEWVARHGTFFHGRVSSPLLRKEHTRIPEPCFETPEFSRRERIRMFRKAFAVTVGMERGLRPVLLRSLKYMRDNSPRYWVDVFRFLGYHLASRWHGVLSR